MILRLTHLIEDVAAALAADANLAGVPVVGISGRYGAEAAINESIAAALGFSGATEAGARTGIAVIVSEPQVVARQMQTPGPAYDVTFAVDVLESRILNTHARTASDVAFEAVAPALWRFNVREGNIVPAVPFGESAPPIIEGEGEAITVLAAGFRLRFVWQSGGSSHTSRAALPAVSVASGNASLTSATAGADIWYTLGDDTAPLPRPGVSAARKYSAPFAVISGQRIRAAAKSTATAWSSTREHEVS